MRRPCAVVRTFDTCSVFALFRAFHGNCMVHNFIWGSNRRQTTRHRRAPRLRPTNTPWETHGLHMNSPRICQPHSTDTPQTRHGHPTTSLDTPRISHGHPMDAPWNIYGCTMVAPKILVRHPKDTIYRQPTDTPLAAHGRPMGAPWTPHGRPMGCSCRPHGPPASGPGTPHGHLTGDPWETPWAHTTDTPRTSHGNSVGALWTPRGHPADTHGKPTDSSWVSQRYLTDTPFTTPGRPTDTPRANYEWSMDITPREWPLDIPWTPHGTHMGFHGWLADCSWDIRSQPMERLWDVHGAPVGCSCAARRLSVRSPCVVLETFIERPMGVGRAPVCRLWGVCGQQLENPT